MNHLKIIFKKKRRLVGANLISLSFFCYAGKIGGDPSWFESWKILAIWWILKFGCWRLKVEGGWVPQQFEFQWKFLKQTFFKIYTDVWFMMLYDALCWLLLLKKKKTWLMVIISTEKNHPQSYQQQLRGLSQCSTYSNTSRESFIPSVTFMIHALA